MLNYGPTTLIMFSVFLSVFVGILMNRRDATSLKDDMNRQFDGVNRRFDEVNRQFVEVHDHLNRIDEDLREFYGM
ncbi:hypothetical protein [Terriglobus sp.]|uniref:hypothetical protein n=1 Tax=Terriglobus sp. TaxID=1889013 RepID=UPI003AFF81E7